jgi:hypothetical protein
VNQYRVSLWIENQGDIPDKYLQVQTNGVPEFDEVAAAAVFLAGCKWVREVQVEWFWNGVWNLVYRRTNRSLVGAEGMCLQ